MTHRIARIESDPVRKRLTLYWKDGSISTKDLRRDIASRPMFAALADAKIFARVRVLDGGYAIGWPRTEIAFAADGLWYEAHPRELPWPDAVMTAAEFKGWLKSERLSLTTASDLLGLSRRTIAYYASGERTIPRVVFIACMAVATARKRRRAA
ncbi:MAG: DUF2442 domain-containing protein [Myxococcota bacterium]|nr:DUF2442 domain-containing protein [Myxococcota bacterium]